MKKISKVILCFVGVLMAAESAWSSEAPASAGISDSKTLVVRFNVPEEYSRAWTAQTKGRIILSRQGEVNKFTKKATFGIVSDTDASDTTTLSLPGTGKYRLIWNVPGKDPQTIGEFDYSGGEVPEIVVTYNGADVPVTEYKAMHHVETATRPAPGPAALTEGQRKQRELEEARAKGGVAERLQEEERQKEENARLERARQEAAARQAAAESARQEAIQQEARAKAQREEDAARAHAAAQEQARKKAEQEAAARQAAAESARLAKEQQNESKERTSMGEEESHQRATESAIKAQQEEMARQRAEEAAKAADKQREEDAQKGGYIDFDFVGPEAEKLIKSERVTITFHRTDGYPDDSNRIGEPILVTSASHVKASIEGTREAVHVSIRVDGEDVYVSTFVPYEENNYQVLRLYGKTADWMSPDAARSKGLLPTPAAASSMAASSASEAAASSSW